METEQTVNSHVHHLKWVEQMKAIALIWIFINHTVERLFGYPFIANPSADWPPLAERLAQLRPLQDFGLWTIPLNILRYIGWSGDQGVQLFLLLSGFGLTWGLLISGREPFPAGKFYLHRAGRIYPMWWGVHLLFMATWVLTGWGLSLFSPATYLSFLGFRLTPGLFYYFSPAWWYIGLIIQLYLVYPFLWMGLRRWGGFKLLVIGCMVGFMARFFGLYFFSGYMDTWQRGAIFITRLPDFVLGISLAYYMFKMPRETDQKLRTRLALLLALGAYLLGTLSSLILPGMIVAPFLLAAGVFVILYQLLGGRNRAVENHKDPIVWAGEHSYSLYLMHHPLVLLFVPAILAGGPQIILGILLALAFTVVGAVILERMVTFGSNLVNSWYNRLGLLRTLFRIVGFGALVLIVLIGGEFLTRWLAPQEILGWGERPSLEPDGVLGWRLIPSQETHLRWQSYDYIVSSNKLGFPGPVYSEQKAPGTFRILVTGDAFSSAEGVNTDQAWPRLLEKELASQLGRKVEVLNFAITGYGPNQYAAVIEKYAPVYKPDLIIVQTFVNDFQDAVWSNEGFQQSIGFGLPSQNSLSTILRLENLRRFVRLQVIEPVNEIVRDEPRDQGFFLGNFAALERHQSEDTLQGQEITARRLREIKTVADQIGARLLVIMVPAPVQICGPDQLAYYPRNVDIKDSNLYDLDLPQNEMKAIVESLNLTFLDLRGDFASNTGKCPYQPHNMHWTTSGHQAVAEGLADFLISDPYYTGQ